MKMLSCFTSSTSRLARPWVLLCLAVLGGTTGCAPSGDPLAITTGAPSGVQYASNPARYPYGIEITPNILLAQGSPIQSASINTVLPEGLEFDSAKGTISGTPTSITASQEFIVTARNSFGSNFTRLILEITDIPPVMTYADPTTLNLSVNVAGPTLTPDLTGGATTSCEAIPPLPAGMTLSDQCVISGTPVAGQASTTHLVSAINSGGSSTVEFTITVNDLATDLRYTGSPFSWIRGSAITQLEPDATGGGIITSCEILPALPAGLSLAADCAISGTPAAVAVQADYVITGSNVNGVTDSATIKISVEDILPVPAFEGSPFTFTRNTAINAIAPANTGGPIDTCVSAPALPEGLSLSNACVITGTPNVASNATTYTLTATNDAGSAPVDISIMVTDLPPKLTYFGTSFAFVAGQAITPIVPIPSNGGDITSCTSTPPLPAGLSVHNATCVISGTPAVGAALKAYVITASNNGGSVQKTLSITIQEIPPSISYAGSPFTFEKNVAFTPITASNSGGAITTCNVSPGLPTGISLSNSCAISGTPSAPLAAANYVVTATNAAGTSNATVNITITDQAPIISYPGSPYSFTRNSIIATIIPVNAGGPITACISAPLLPAGLSIADTTCAISGTPSAVASTANYTITATNATGSNTAIISLTVNDIPPAITYPGSPFNFTKNVAIPATNAINTGGPIVSCIVAPALPAGLTLSAACGISGTASVLSDATPYTITATNSGGSANAIITLAIKDASPSLSFDPTAHTFTKDVPITTLTPALTGGALSSCNAAPALPPGLIVNAATCAISGTPTQVSTAANYVITATNTGGSSSATLNITVNDTLPIISYAGAPFTYTKGSAIAVLNPTNTGGAIVSCSSTPTLPAGLSLSNGCVISGTPGVVAAATDYTITATNSAGTASTPLNIRVNDIPPVISYAGSPFTHVVGTPIAPLAVSSTGGAITGCSSTPALPSGLLLSATCTLSGTPSAPAAQTDYVITATNSGGSANDTLRITVNDIPPNISFTGSPYRYPKTVAITPLGITNTGGAVVSCVSAPELPAGLSIAANCGISGTPTLITAAANYTITATNSGGTSSKAINIEITDAPPAFSYSGGPFTYTKNVAITDLTPTSTGGIITSCVASPALPAGLSVSNDCAISGTPSALSASTSYNITGTNEGGSTATSVTLAVVDVPPAIDYIPTSYNFIYTRNVVIDPLTPNSTAGPIVNCTISPALPTGLTINSSNCTISGTPVATRAATDFTVTATNTGGSSAAVITISVLDQAPSISYSGGPYTLYKGVVMAAISPANAGGASSSCAANPALPIGLNLSNGCVISGNPGALNIGTEYTITATNAIGSSSAVVTITVVDPPPAINFVGSPYSFQKDLEITPVNPGNTGGPPATCTSDPALPPGLAISNSCVITGTPTTITAATNYTITATNSTGNSVKVISIATPDTPPSISYAGGPFSYPRNSAIAPLAVSNAGGAILSCTPTPALPAGLSLSATCEITGTPTVTTAGANYTIAATNSGGTHQTTINITILEIPPNVSYTPASYLYTISEAITDATPANTGGPITSCSAAPALPAGLSLSSGCVISGTPTVQAVATDYTITATGTAGSDDTVVNIRVRGLPKILYYGYTALNGSDNGSAPLSKNVWKSSSDGSTREALTQNSNASLDSVVPAVSVDGTTIAYASFRALDGSTNGTATLSQNIWKSSSLGTAPTNLTQNSLATLDSDTVAFSPDGLKVAFASKMDLSGASDGTPTGSYNLWIMNVDGTGKTHLTANTNAGLDSFNPVFSPDGSTLYFHSKTSLTRLDNGAAPASFNIWKVNVDGTNRINLTAESTAGRDSYYPRVSPDGTLIVFQSKARIGITAAFSFNVWKVKPDGTLLGYLTNKTAANLDSKQPNFSHDGTEIVFASKMNVNASVANSFNIWKMASDGTSQVPLTKNNAASLDSDSPHFSANDLKVIFSSRMNIGATPAQSSNIWIMNDDGTSQTPLTGNTNAGLDSLLPSGEIWFQD